MKLIIITIVTIIYNCFVVAAELPPSLFPAFQAKKSLEKRLSETTPGEILWILVPMEDSFENELMERMREKPEWENQLSLYRALSFAEVREFVKRVGFAIVHSEIERGVMAIGGVGASRDWVERELLPQLHLESEEKLLFVDELVEIMRGKVYFPYKQLLMCIRRE